MENPKAVRRSFYINISLIVVAIVSALLMIIFTLMFFTIKSIYFENFQKHTVDVNNFVVAQINGDKIEEYSKTFNKDAYYFELNDMLYRLKAIFEIKYLYILADTGDPGTYTYIFDAIYDEKTQTYDDSQYGVSEDRSVFPESQPVLETGIPFEYATYSDTEEYGRLFYSYNPITNSKGEVVAFLGTDISAEKMFGDINNVMIFLIMSGVVSFLVIFLAVMFYCKEFVSKPIIKLSADVTIFSEGELGIEIPEKLLNRKDELGLIYRSFRSVIVTIGDLMRNLDQTVNNVIKGNIEARIDHENLFRGSYENIAESIDLLMYNARKIFDLMPVYFFIYDYDFNPLYRNTPVQSFIEDESADAALKNEITGLLHEALKENFFSFTRFADENCTGSFYVALSNATVRHYNYFLIKNNPRRDIKNICCVLTDVTDYVEMSKHALASSVAKSEFLSKMSHEIRTPMNAIIGMTEIAQRQTDIGRIMGNLYNIKTASSHLLTIINDILDFSKIESGKMEISHSIFDLDKLQKSVLAIAGKLASDKGITLKIDLENHLSLPLTFLGDEIRIMQVLINLLSNAIKFSPQDSEVRLLVRVESGEAQNKTKIGFSVKDNGIGIPPEKIEKIFEAFEQGGSDITRNFGGTGLGMPISNNLVKLMGGEKIFVSSDPGKGSEFSFTLEFENAAASDEDDDISDNLIDFGGKRLMLVDDIEINREIVISLLEGSGIEIDCCDDGTDAVEKFAGSPENYYDLIFMDIQMKIMDGYEASKSIRALDRRDASAVTIIAMSANAFQNDIDEAHAAGMNDYIVKPIDSNIMIKKMKKYLSADN